MLIVYLFVYYLFTCFVLSLFTTCLPVRLLLVCLLFCLFTGLFSRMMDYFRALGCLAKKNPKKPGDMNADTSCTCTLNIPLTFPKPRQGKKRKEY